MKKIVKFLLLGVIVLAVAGGIVYSMTAPVTAPLTLVTAGTAELSFSEQGTVVAESVVQVYPAAQGRLERVSAEEGGQVNAGDVLCVIDSEPLRLQISQIRSLISGYGAQISNLDTERERSVSELTTSRNSLLGELAALAAEERSSDISLETQNVSVEDSLRIQDILIAQSENDLNRAKDELAKAEALYGAGGMSRAEYNAALDLCAKYETALETAKLERSVIAGGKAQSREDYFKGAKASLNAQIEGIDRSLTKDYTGAMKEYYRALIQSDEASIAQIENDIANCSVTAPVSGIITKLNAKSANYVSAAAPVAEITVPGGGTVEVYVSTQDVDSIRPGDTAALTLKRREGDVTFGGEVRDIDTTAEIRLSALGVEERKVKVRISPQLQTLAGGVSFGVGYSVDVKFSVYREENKFTVPKTALFKDGGKDMLWVVRGGSAEAAEVVKGMELRTETVIDSGLAEGDYVVTDANNKDLRNGVKIKGE